ncbi:RNA polymerase subunit (RPO19) [Eptesipox virus]|uniref:DNA-directed RNA polymerase 19 kDa subunit n=1 Tax=Eptesipox virus TaxID=1329402 RepID=A0A220T6G6_9POXV|nr:RNA polymerase subunit (RPO19) [Eptesipox virus]ASK51302.1 RNA polymerase subunit (RPO19) [Eptesipox virus]WAH71060.1 RNA polymerase subunit RPO19 [Eptesipox virus]
MADSGDIIDYVSEEDDDSEYSITEDENEDSSLDSPETSDFVSYKPSNINFESNSIHIEEDIPQYKNISAKISALKRRYTRRISLIEITGIIAESFNLLQRGRLPLVQNLSNDTLKQKMLHIIIQEIKEGTCPIIIEKNGELLSINDFDKKGIDTHIEYITNIWKLQNRY